MTSGHHPGLAEPLWQPSPRLGEPLAIDPGYRFRLVAQSADGAPPGGDDAEATARVLRCLAGHSLAAAEIATATGVAGERLAVLLDRLYGDALIAIDSALPLPAGPCCRHFIAYSRQVAGALELPALRRRISLDDHDAVLRLGAYVEEYHYIRAVASYLAAALSAASTARQRAILAEYLADEHWHDAWVARGLHAAGIAAAELARAQPLPSTLALLNLLRWTAASDLPALCVCLAATEGTPASLPEIAAEFDSLRRSPLLPEAVWAPFERHARIDAEQSHGSVFGEVFVDAGWITPGDRERLRDTVWQYWYAYRGFYQGIVGYYAGQPSLRLLAFG